MRKLIVVLSLVVASVVPVGAQYRAPYYGGYGDLYGAYRQYRDYRSYQPSGRGWSNPYQNYYGREQRGVSRWRYDWSWGGGNRGYLGGRGGGWGGEW